MLPSHSVMILSFLSRLLGGEPKDSSMNQLRIFLSRLLGGEHLDDVEALASKFLSRLLGGELE